jgi:hypothetical protein
MDLAVQKVDHIADFDAHEWDALGAGNLFSSHAWHRYGEQAMTGCKPLYLVVRQDKQAVARASFWLVPNEPLPVGEIGQPWNNLLRAFFHRWPLLICRSPLADASGLALPDTPARDQALRAIVDAAQRYARSVHASYMIFDYLDAQQASLPGWPGKWSVMRLAEPGTCLPIIWDSYDQFLKDLPKSAWKDYRRQANQASRMGLQVSTDEPVNSEEALPLIRSVERKHGSLPKPWITARIDGRLVGCGLLLHDNGVFLATLLGLDYTCSYVYFQILYRAIRETISQGGQMLRAGSGAYDLKQRLGLKIEDNNHLRFAGQNHLLGWLGSLALA